MKNDHDLLAVFCACLVTLGASAEFGMTQAQDAGTLRGRLMSNLTAYEADDVPTLYLQFENRSEETVTGYYANEEEMGTFPCDLVRVTRNDERLPWARSNESHPRPAFLTSLHPGGTLTIAVSLDHLCDLPPDPRGAYVAQILADYYPGYVSAEPIRFEVVSALPSSTQRGRLAGARWEAERIGLSREDREELSRIARSTVEASGLRARAIRLLRASSSDPDTIGLSSDLIGDGHPMVALAAIASIPGAPSEREIDALLTALFHNDVAVRRAAARQLVGAALGAAELTNLEGSLASNEDELVRRYIGSALGR